ncbi:MAG: hypothetical protein HQK49_15045 [Oligoflexia bacterium]|nr:hypothetical protein [Oligoflexia bacterium]
MNIGNINTEKIREEIINMSTLVEKMLKECLTDESKFDDIVILENQVNKFHTKIDDICFKFIALKRPMARDLRMALSAIKINTDLERIADLAFNIKRAKMRIDSSGHNFLKQISTEVELMLKNAIDAFSQSDIRLASEVIQHDQIVNELNKHIIQIYTSCENQVENQVEIQIEKQGEKQGENQYKKTNIDDKNNVLKERLNFGEAYHIVLISNKLERIGDHTTNIAEDVIFLESGKDVRHQQYSSLIAAAEDHNRSTTES